MKYKVIFFCRSANGGYKCPKCAKIVEDKAGLRKHLVYHTHREKKYMYQCPQCPALSADSSNLKRHIASVHEKHLFCCKLCDFKDYKKKHLEDHIEPGVSILTSYGEKPHYVKLPIFSEFMENSAKFMKNSGLTKWTQNLR